MRLPGIFEPVRIGDRYLFDGALVNPVPVTVCRALGADFVIAVNVTADTMYRSTVLPNQSAAAHADRSGRQGAFRRSRRRGAGRRPAAPLFRAARRRRAECRDGDDRRLQHHSGSHTAFAARRRPAGRHDPRASRGNAACSTFIKRTSSSPPGARPPSARCRIFSPIPRARRVGLSPAPNHKSLPGFSMPLGRERPLSPASPPARSDP